MTGLDKLYFLTSGTGDWFKDGIDVTSNINYAGGDYSGDSGSTTGSIEYTGTTVKVKMELASTRTISDNFLIYITEFYDHQGVTINLLNSSTVVLTKTFSGQSATEESRFFFFKNSSSLTFDNVEFVFTTRASDNKIKLETTSAKTTDVNNFYVDIGSGYAITSLLRIRILPVSSYTLLDKDEYEEDSFLFFDEDYTSTAGYTYFVPVEIEQITDAIYVSTDVTTRWKILGRISDSFDSEFARGNGAMLTTAPDTSKDGFLVVHGKSTASGSFRIQFAEQEDLTGILLDSVNDTLRYKESRVYTDDRYVFKYLQSNWLSLRLDLGYIDNTSFLDLRNKLDLVKQDDRDLFVDYENKIYFMEIEHDLNFSLKKELYRINLTLEEKKI